MNDILLYLISPDFLMYTGISNGPVEISQELKYANTQAAHCFPGHQTPNSTFKAFQSLQVVFHLSYYV